VILATLRAVTICPFSCVIRSGKTTADIAASLHSLENNPMISSGHHGMKLAAPWETNVTKS
jgi:hypothetical protein